MSSSENSASAALESMVDIKDEYVAESPDAVETSSPIANEEENETHAQAFHWTQHLQMSTPFSKDYLEKERRSGRLELRSKQAAIHLSSTELRIAELEAKLGELQGVLQEGRNDYKRDERKDKRCPVHMPVLRWTALDNFHVLGRSDHPPPSHLPAIEVLYSKSEATPDLEAVPRPKAGSENATDHAAISDTGFIKSPQRLRIRSWPLLAHLESICGEDFSLQYVTSGNRSPVVLLRPFKVLFLFENEIRKSVLGMEEKARDAEDKEKKAVTTEVILENLTFEWKHLLADLGKLIEFMNTALRPTFQLRESVENKTLKKIEYADLWHLFSKGDTIIRPGDDRQAFRVVGITGGRGALVSKMPSEYRTPPVYGFVVDCISLEYNGTHYAPQLHKFHIPNFTGYRRVCSLDFYPVEFDQNADKLKDQLIENGRKYLDLTRESHVHNMCCGRTVGESPEHIEGQIVVDTAMALNAEPNWRLSSTVQREELTAPDLRETYLQQPCRHGSSPRQGCCGGDVAFNDQRLNIDRQNAFWKEFSVISRPRTEEELGDDLILLPSTVHGFVLRLRKWVTVRIRDLSPVAFDNDFDNLMMNETHKQSILALVETHEKSQFSSNAKGQSIGTSLDLVRGKGTGLIMLLHGEPGVGKTSTAECVADRTKRPLFPITCGDIGETAIEVEQKLQQNFRLAHRWGSVLVLDEADIFLAKRNKTDLRRNAVTSVFLRSLDYYAGILFLTTNRVGTIDPAFKSRIHLTVFYPRLDLDRTLKLFEVFIQKTKEELRNSDKATFQIKPKEILRFAKRNFRSLEKHGYSTWNGRQIRNAFQTAIALVEYDAAHMNTDKPSLGKKQFEVVAEGSKQFEVYLRRTLQGIDADIAMRDQWRDDTFELGDLENSNLMQHLQTPFVSSKKLRERSRAMKSDASVTESESELESESEVSNTKGGTGESRTMLANDKKDKSKASLEGEEYQEFLKFQAMRKAMGK